MIPSQASPGARFTGDAYPSGRCPPLVETRRVREGREHRFSFKVGQRRRRREETSVVPHREESFEKYVAPSARAKDGYRTKTSLPKGIFMVSMICLVTLVENITFAGAFTPAAFFFTSTRKNFSERRAPSLATYIGDDESTEGDSGSGDGDDQDSTSLVWDDLSWRVEKLRLEEANTKRFLKARPRFLPYDECCKWVQAWNRWESKEDWENWIMEGEKRNSYIPARPEEYYGRLGQWISWDHFLGKTDSKSSANAK
mmetsp:Transcript_61508/g.181774  ORF Transcript_61508/g.181774 Transcript_61508/m.181774 type:complete len:256 (-) Transcript_61508:592-1359(-)|eukprot:CAMPEP_0113575678 /NCGR_PEP_ID=MMETSP0015_2-20120614/27833_1 /TAXON_ID=2838 /ORGANISM="Odontella" /LENGTH=255 /DNA_ID=CAMNT_0000478947 /DNA_START=126 /DNA_END=893 /DNA_ORIENTATION=+ /assembly_acc=CAM_ASM_000160